MPDERAIEPSVKMVKIRNATRIALTFQVPGRSIHLLPGQSTEVHKPYLDTAELKLLCQRGTVIELKPPPPPSPPAGAAKPRREGTRAKTTVGAEAEATIRTEAMTAGRVPVEKG